MTDEMAGARRGGPQVAHFFVPLPAPLGVPDGHMHGVSIRSELDFGTLRQWCESGHSEPAPPDGIEAIIRVHQVTLSPREALGEFEALVDLARTILPDGVVPASRQSAPPPSEPADDGLVRSIAEVAIEVPSEVRAENEIAGSAELASRFDIGLEVLRDFQRAYALVTRHWTPLVTRQLLPMAIPLAIESKDNHWMFSTYVVNDLAIARFVPAKALRSRDLDLIANVANAEAIGHPFARYAELARESRTNLWAYGNTRAAAVFAYTAGEVLLNSLLEHLLWEEGADPEHVADNVFFGTGLATRLRRHYHERLYGPWAAGPVRDWTERSARLRHDTVHTGYEPTFDEATSALEAADALDDFVRGRLADPRVMMGYPRTVLAVMGGAGIPSEGSWRRRFEALTESPDEPPWLERWIRWKWVLDDRMLEREGFDRPEPEPAEVGAVLVVEADDSYQWFLHDLRNHRVRPGEAPADLHAPPEELIRRAREEDEAGRISLAHTGHPRVPAANGWMRDYKVVPGYEIHHGRPRDLPP